MPNDCWNNIIFVSEDNSEELAELFDKEIKEQNLTDEFLKIHYKGKNL